MTEEQVERILTIAARQREEMANTVAAIIRNSPLEDFLPESSKAAFLEWAEEQVRKST